MTRTNLLAAYLAGMLVLLGVAHDAAAQAARGRRGNEPPAIVSPEVHGDGRVTFRLLAPRVRSVDVDSGELSAVMGATRKAMTRGADGLWSLTIGPVPPGIYDYTFVIDGVRNTDPSSTNVFGNRQGSRGFVEVPSESGSARRDQWRDVPHGAVTIHWYNSPAAGGQRRRLHVYTPPGYGDDAQQRYPVLYLLHGSGDNDSHWTVLGRANVIADNLIADGRAQPMIIVMPDGHVPLPRVDGEDRDAERARANAAFEQEMIESIVPLVESQYRTAGGRDARAITGLSMGGGQSLRVGLSHIDQFAWVGAFSASARSAPELVAKLPDDVNRRLRLLWIAIGKDDFLLEDNHSFVALLKDRGVNHEYHETEGAHRWSVWRGYLADFLPRLFQKPT